MLVNLFHVWLSRRQWIIKFVSALNQLQYVVLVEVGKENPASYRYLVGKVRCILTAFPGHGRYFLILHQNSTSGNFLMIRCHVESETVSVNLLSALTWTPIHLSCLWEGRLTCAWLTQTFQMHTLHYTISDITLNITTNVITKAWVLGRRRLEVEDGTHLEFSILSESSTPLQATNTASHLPRDETLAQFIFEKVSANAYVWITTVHLWIVLSGKNRKKRWWAGEELLSSWLCHIRAFPQDNTTVQSIKRLCVLPATSHKCQKDVDPRALIKNIYSLALHRNRKNFNAWPWTSQVNPPPSFATKAWCWPWSQHLVKRPLKTVLRYLPIYPPAPGSFCITDGNAKKKNNFLVSLWEQFWPLGLPKKGFEYPQWSVDHTLRTAALIILAMIMWKKYSLFKCFYT